MRWSQAVLQKFTEAPQVLDSPLQSNCWEHRSLFLAFHLLVLSSTSLSIARTHPWWCWYCTPGHIDRTLWRLSIAELSTSNEPRYQMLDFAGFFLPISKQRIKFFDQLVDVLKEDGDSKVFLYRLRWVIFSLCLLTTPSRKLYVSIQFTAHSSHFFKELLELRVCILMSLFKNGCYTVNCSSGPNMSSSFDWRLIDSGRKSDEKLSIMNRELMNSHL